VQWNKQSNKHNIDVEGREKRERVREREMVNFRTLLVAKVKMATAVDERMSMGINGIILTMEYRSTRRKNVPLSICPR
jgi:hypothetical protein